MWGAKLQGLDFPGCSKVAIIRIGFIGFRGIAYYSYNDSKRAIIIRIGFIGFGGIAYYSYNKNPATNKMGNHLGPYISMAAFTQKTWSPSSVDSASTAGFLLGDFR